MADLKHMDQKSTPGADASLATAPTTAPVPAATGPAHPVAAAFHTIDQQRLRILRCTAQALDSSLGGLRFKAGSQPWLQGLPAGLKPAR